MEYASELSERVNPAREEESMIDDPQGIKSSFSEKMRLIRFRRKKENLRFWQEFKLVPRWLIWAVIVLFMIAQIIGQSVLHVQLAHHQDVFGPELDSDPGAAGAALFGIITGASFVVAIMVFMVGYVNKDAKRRGMHSALWTFLVLVLMPGYLVLGFIIYLLMREPLPYNCPQCGATVDARFNFCPNCKCNLHPACPTCKREVAETDKFCAYCGTDLEPAKTAQPKELPSVPR
ncbi:MAG TPA: zinc ribbon domain-containing protein [Candidatus Saccharimonadales bacterium]|nr:zinc ribbon domain-containing protein [Candidatus Saccharimonadales bacterium]